MNRVEVIRIENLPEMSGNVIALASIRVGDFQFNNLRIINSEGNMSVYLPAIRGEDERLSPIVVVHNADLKRAIDEAVLSAWLAMKE